MLQGSNDVNGGIKYSHEDYYILLLMHGVNKAKIERGYYKFSASTDFSVSTNMFTYKVIFERFYVQPRTKDSSLSNLEVYRREGGVLLDNEDGNQYLCTFLDITTGLIIFPLLSRSFSIPKVHLGALLSICVTQSPV